jgi:hypothetical protein
MTDINTPAFPTPAHNLANDGMTLRDYFAAKAMQGICASGPTIDNGRIALEAYQLADAMLKAREAKHD